MEQVPALVGYTAAGNGGLPQSALKGISICFKGYSGARDCGRYERNEVNPSIDVATKIAEALGVSLDYLTGHSDLELDKARLNRIVDIQNLSEEDKKNALCISRCFSA